MWKVDWKVQQQPNDGHLSVWGQVNKDGTTLSYIQETVGHKTDVDLLIDWYSSTGCDLRSALRYWLAAELVVQDTKVKMATINAAKNQLAIAMSDVEDSVYERFFGKL